MLRKSFRDFQSSRSDRLRQY